MPTVIVEKIYIVLSLQCSRAMHLDHRLGPLPLYRSIESWATLLWT